MAYSWGDDTANEIGNAYIKGTTFTVPADCFLHLYLDEPDDNGAGGTVLPADGWWAPISVRSAMSAFANRQSSNSSTISCGTPLVSRGPIKCAVLRAGSSAASRMIAKALLPTFITTVVGQALDIPTGQLVFRIP